MDQIDINKLVEEIIASSNFLPICMNNWWRKKEVVTPLQLFSRLFFNLNKLKKLRNISVLQPTLLKEMIYLGLVCTGCLRNCMHMLSNVMCFMYKVSLLTDVEKPLPCFKPRERNYFNNFLQYLYKLIINRRIFLNWMGELK